MPGEPLGRELRFKRLTTENWLTVDPTWADFVMSQSHPDPGKAWVTDILAPNLNESAPMPVVRLFEVARGALVYGLAFYPLLVIGLDQLTRVVEAAAAAKCAELGAPPGVNRYARYVDWLVANGVIHPDHEQRWRAAVALRNETSHPDEQNLYPPGWVLGLLDGTVEMISHLYPIPPA